MPYHARRPAHLQTAPIRGLTFQLYRWPGTDPQPVLLVHGWGDTGETYQFLVDQLSPERTLVAYDARGFGRTQHPDDGYWFPDYLADLDAVVDLISPDRPVDLIGHSMGGNVAMLYAGARPQRVRKLVSLEGFGLMRTTPEQAPSRYAEWLDEVKHGTDFSTYDNLDQLLRVLSRRNPRTPAEHLEFIARSWSRQRDDGRIEMRADPKHKRVNPVLYQREQAEACWRAITAPVLFVIAELSELALRMAEEIRDENLQRLFADLTVARMKGVGHMMHHERPAEVAALIDGFLSA